MKMTNSSNAPRMVKVYKLMIEDSYSSEINEVGVYRHRSSANRAMRKHELQYPENSFWIETTTVAEYNLALFQACLRESRQEELQKENIEFIENNIDVIYENLTKIVNDIPFEKSMCELIRRGQSAVDEQFIEVPKSLLIESIYFRVTVVFKFGEYDFGIGLKTKESEYAESLGGITYEIHHGTFTSLRKGWSITKEKLAEILKEVVTRRIYRRY